jgi:hypothetical protein
VKDFEIVVDIEAPPERVRAVLCDVERWHEWTASVTSIRRLDNGPFAVGSKARVIQPKLRPAVWEVTTLDSRGFVWSMRAPGVQVAGEHWIEAKGAGSRVRLALHFSGLLGGFLGYLYRDLNQRYLGMEAEGLRRRCESAG